MLATVRKIRCLRISFGEGYEILNSKMRREDKVGFEMLRTKVRAAGYEVLQDKIVMSQDKTTLLKGVKVEK